MVAHESGRTHCNDSDGALLLQAVALCRSEPLESSQLIQGSLCSGHLLTTHFSQAFRWALETDMPLSPKDSRESTQPRGLQLHHVADAGVTGESRGGKSML